ncbi:MAG: DUF1499 domain-containing protein [Bacillota bacterium]
MHRLSSSTLPGLLVLGALLAAAGCTNTVVPDYGPREGHLPPCPPNKDCVSSQDTDPKLYIAPMPYVAITGDLQGTRDKAHSDLVSAINAAGAARIVSNRRNYVRVEYPAAGETQRKSDYYYQPDEAVDEIQFYLSPGSRLIEIYSVGKLGVLDNSDARDRVEKIRVIFQQLQQKPPK